MVVIAVLMTAVNAPGAPPDQASPSAELAPGGAAAPPAPAAAIEAEVLANVIGQPLGPDTLDVLHLPPKFLQRLSDRIIRSSFEQRHRLVVQDTPASGPAPDPGPGRTGHATGAPNPSAPADVERRVPSELAGDSARRTRLMVIGALTIAAALATIIMALRARRSAP